MIIFLALGSNVGDKTSNIEKAIDLLGAKVSQIVSAPLYESKAVGYLNQDNFINTAIRGETDLTPGELLAFIKGVEHDVGRVERFRWGPREIDIDIIFFGREQYNEENLSIPHSHYRERDFVLQPLIDIDKNLRDPTDNVLLSDIYERLDQSQLSIFNKL